MAERENEMEGKETGPGGRAVSRRRLLKTLGGAATAGAGTVLLGQAAAAGATGTADKIGVFQSKTRTAVYGHTWGLGPAIWGINDAGAGERQCAPSQGVPRGVAHGDDGDGTPSVAEDVYAKSQSGYLA